MVRLFLPFVGKWQRPILTPKFARVLLLHRLEAGLVLLPLPVLAAALRRLNACHIGTGANLTSHDGTHLIHTCIYLRPRSVVRSWPAT